VYDRLYLYCYFVFEKKVAYWAYHIYFSNMPNHKIVSCHVVKAVKWGGGASLFSSSIPRQCKLPLSLHAYLDVS